MRRSNTKDVSTFHLPPPNGVDFTFPPPSLNSPVPHIRINIANSSQWQMPLHWHPQEEKGPGCKRLTCVSGFIHIYTTNGWGCCNALMPASRVTEFKPGQRMSFFRNEFHADESLIVDLEADHTLWRNICSAILDKDLFPQLRSTPLWLKAMFVILPARREALLSFMLQVQLRSIYYYHGVHIYHGKIPASWPWVCQPFGGRQTRPRMPSFGV